MEKTLKVEGMMCEHCEAMVKKSLEALDFISYAQPNHNDNEVLIRLDGEFDEAKVKAAIDKELAKASVTHPEHRKVVDRRKMKRLKSKIA